MAEKINNRNVDLQTNPVGAKAKNNPITDKENYTKASHNFIQANLNHTKANHIGEDPNLSKSKSTPTPSMP